MNDDDFNSDQALLLLNYFISFSVIFHHISQNLLFLREQLSVIEDDDVRAMHDAVRSKYVMFKYVDITSLNYLESILLFASK